MRLCRPDGRISLQLVGEIIAAGRTPAELGTLLTEQYGLEIKEPEVTVIVRSFSAQKIYVDGEVGEVQLVKIVARDPSPPPADYVRDSGGM